MVGLTCYGLASHQRGAVSIQSFYVRHWLAALVQIYLLLMYHLNVFILQGNAARRWKISDGC